MVTFKIPSYILIFNFIFTLIVSLHLSSAGKTDQHNVVEISVKSKSTGKEYDLKLTRADESSVLHNDIKVFSTSSIFPNDTHEIEGKSWTSSGNNNESLFIDQENLAVVRLAYDNEKQEHYPVGGILNGNRLVKISDTDKISNIIEDEFSMPKNHSDYIDLGRTITSSKTRNGGNAPLIVEVALVCDKEFGDKFNHDRQAIVDYWTIYFWDINMRFRTLPSSQISFQINSIVIISSTSEQPFIEQSRASDGRAEFSRILERFSKWIYSKQATLPKYDIAIAVTNTQVEWDGGYAYYSAACWTDHHREQFWGSGVWNDGGDFGSVGIGAHEIAHILGARHDDDPNYPGGPCASRGYIMMGRIGEKKWFFSECSDRTIQEYVNSQQASCLRRLDESSTEPVIQANVRGAAAPSMEEQCKKRLNNPNAFTREEDAGDCNFMKCWVPQKDGGWLYWSRSPVDNTPCRGGGKCFRGRCRGSGGLLVNVGSGQCAIAENPFYYQTPLRMRDCPIFKDTPLEHFVVEEGEEGNGKFLMTPWNTKDGEENGDKCLYTGGWEGDGVWTGKCDKGNKWQGWEMKRVGENDRYFLLRHKLTRRCAKQKDSWIGSHDCNKEDRSMWWFLLEDQDYVPVPVISVG